MTDRSRSERLELPPELRALDEELSSIRYEVRPSFVPELRAELARASTGRPGRHPATWRYLAAAASVALLLAGVAVPSARASLARFVDVISGGARAEAPPVEVSPPVEALPEDRGIAEGPAPEPIGAAAEPVATPADGPAAEPTLLTPPTMLDRERARGLLQDAYPAYLQRRGVGGVVWMRVWVDSGGMASLASVSRSSGVRELDRAALQVAPLLRFEPAHRSGAPVPTWIEFSVLFEPDDADRRDEIDEADVAPAAPLPAEDPMRLPEVAPQLRWEYERPLDLASLPRRSEGVRGPAELGSGLSEAEAALVEGIGDPMVRRALGPVDAILAGVAPQGRDPTEWRTAATAVLGEVIERAPDDPTAHLALGRILLRQGLRTDARVAFERGLRGAIGTDRGRGSSVLADLHFERGKLLRERWMSARWVGRVHAWAFEEAYCLQARSSGQGGGGLASVERLVAWNYLCPGEMDRIFDVGFEPYGRGLPDRALTMASFRAAIAAEPGHVGANVGLLTALADERRWGDVLAGARRFARRSGGHPDALLLAGLALHELGRTAEAYEHFAEGLRRLSPGVADEIRDVGLVLDPEDTAEYRRLGREERRAFEEAFWGGKDRTPGTAVNERRVEHLARSTYALLRFGSLTSGPAEVWVRFGGPHTVHVVDAGAGELTEFWDYGSGPDITFVRWVASQTMDLTAEGRAYVDDLGTIFPPQ